MSIRFMRSHAAALVVLAIALTLAIAAPACASDTGASGFPTTPDGATGDDATVAEGGAYDDAQFDDSPSFGNDGAVNTLKIQPADPVVNVTITDGIVTVAPV